METLRLILFHLALFAVAAVAIAAIEILASVYRRNSKFGKDRHTSSTVRKRPASYATARPLSDGFLIWNCPAAAGNTARPPHNSLPD